MYFSISSQPNGIPFQHRHGYRGRDRGRGTGVICCLHICIVKLSSLLDVYQTCNLKTRLKIIIIVLV